MALVKKEVIKIIIRQFYDHLARKFGMVPHDSKYKETMVKATQPDYQESERDEE